MVMAPQVRSRKKLVGWCCGQGDNENDVGGGRWQCGARKCLMIWKAWWREGVNGARKRVMGKVTNSRIWREREREE